MTNVLLVALYPLSSPNHNRERETDIKALLRYILFHHQTTTCVFTLLPAARCVISSFITKPQLERAVARSAWGCVISSFITKPQPGLPSCFQKLVALYPLSSPNHNSLKPPWLRSTVALYPLSSPNHNLNCDRNRWTSVALYPLSSPNHNLLLVLVEYLSVALYPLSSPNHNRHIAIINSLRLRYILFHHQTTTRLSF